MPAQEEEVIIISYHRIIISHWWQPILKIYRTPTQVVTSSWPQIWILLLGGTKHRSSIRTILLANSSSPLSCSRISISSMLLYRLSLLQFSSSIATIVMLSCLNISSSKLSKWRRYLLRTTAIWILITCSRCPQFLLSLSNRFSSCRHRRNNSSNLASLKQISSRCIKRTTLMQTV